MRELGLSAMFVTTSEKNAIIVYVSESMTEILGYESKDLLGKSSSRARDDRIPRTFYLLDRFTETARIMFASNDLIINGSKLKGQSLYSIIRPSDRAKVRQWIEAAKTWAPVVFDDERSGGHGYLNFSVLKIPDFPPQGITLPQGTDETERSMPGQEFIPVEGIFIASSDGIACVIGLGHGADPATLASGSGGSGTSSAAASGSRRPSSR
ncbi:hypothetical protein Q8F55_007671 [Vanrija albida]|uniref:PAS domain-containing protein n=1 Tax=Vanrija albida TaxID=181172 RepID=A0ABR3PU63_9TREE